MQPFKFCIPVIASRNEDFDDEGVIALASLPKLESLELYVGGLVTGRVFKHFKTLRKISCFRMKITKEGVRHLIRNCSNLQEIHILSVIQ